MYHDMTWTINDNVDILWVHCVALSGPTARTKAVALAAVNKYREGRVNKDCLDIAKHSANMTISLGVLNYIVFSGIPLVVLGSYIVNWASKSDQKAEQQQG